MNIITNELTGRTHDQLLTEIMFFVVSAGSVGADLIKLKINGEEDESVSEKQLAEALRILRSLKRRRMIQLFISSDGFKTQTTEIEYLLNKYPNLTPELSDNNCFIIKL